MRRGTTAIEFAMVLPVWALLVVAMFDFGWLLYQQTALDAAANLGCRAGSLLDPGESDQNLVEVLEASTEEMEEVLRGFGAKSDDLEVDAYTMGEPPGRSLVCVVSLDVTPLTGMVTRVSKLRTSHVARLEWQREAAP